MPLFPSVLDLAALNGANGFRIDGIDPADRSGWSVASAGDVNGDGYDDIIIGARGADPNGDSAAGEAYVVFGKASDFGTIDLSGLTAEQGFVMSESLARSLNGELLTILEAHVKTNVEFQEEVKVTLSGDEEVPAVTTAAKGEGMITVRPDKSVTGTVTTSGVDGIAAHIHVAPLGKNGPPIITLVKAGEGKWTTPEGAKLTDEQYQSFEAGNLYINVHSARHKSGEIRGQLQP